MNNLLTNDISERVNTIIIIHDLICAKYEDNMNYNYFFCPKTCFTCLMTYKNSFIWFIYNISLFEHIDKSVLQLLNNLNYK